MESTKHVFAGIGVEMGDYRTLLISSSSTDDVSQLELSREVTAKGRSASFPSFSLLLWTESATPPFPCTAPNPYVEVLTANLIYLEMCFWKVIRFWWDWDRFTIQKWNTAVTNTETHGSSFRAGWWVKARQVSRCMLETWIIKDNLGEGLIWTWGTCYWMKGSLCNKVHATVLWKTELASNETGYLTLEISKQSVEEATWSLLTA